MVQHGPFRPFPVACSPSRTLQFGTLRNGSLPFGCGSLCASKAHQPLPSPSFPFPYLHSHSHPHLIREFIASHALDIHTSRKAPPRFALRLFFELSSCSQKDLAQGCQVSLSCQYTKSLPPQLERICSSIFLQVLFLLIHSFPSLPLSTTKDGPEYVPKLRW